MSSGLDGVLMLAAPPRPAARGLIALTKGVSSGPWMRASHSKKLDWQEGKNAGHGELGSNESELNTSSAGQGGREITSLIGPGSETIVSNEIS